MKMLSFVVVIAALSCVRSEDFADNSTLYEQVGTPLANMVSALRGYNILSGNPYKDGEDPGFSSRIFQIAVKDNFGDYVLVDGITHSELAECENSLSAHVFSSIKSYRDFISKSSSSGVDLQVGTEAEVTAGIPLEGVEVSATTKIPRAFERSWGESEDFRKLSSFFREKHGLIRIVKGICIVYKMSIDRFLLPPFTNAFKAALGELYENRYSTEPTKKHLFQNFIKDYGTHYLSSAKLGAQYIHRTRFRSDSRENFDTQLLHKCSYVKGAKLFGIQLEEDSSSCSKEDKQKLVKFFSNQLDTIEFTKGSKPLADLNKWMEQKFTPVPLKYELKPIVNLMVERNIEKKQLNTSSGKPINSTEIRKWFLPMYFNYCSSMDLKCNYKESGCGEDDACPIDAYCEGKGKIHDCREWTEWSCEDCGFQKQSRKRKCVGCRGKTKQIRDHPCDKSECTGYLSCDKKKVNPKLWIGWRSNCSNGYGIKSITFNGDKFTWENYTCCKLPRSCENREGQFRNKTGTFLDIDVVRPDYEEGSIDCGINSVVTGSQVFTPLWRFGNSTYSYNCCESKSEKLCYTEDSYPTVECKGDGYFVVKVTKSNNKQGKASKYRITCCKEYIN